MALCDELSFSYPDISHNMGAEISTRDAIHGRDLLRMLQLGREPHLHVADCWKALVSSLPAFNLHPSSLLLITKNVLMSPRHASRNSLTSEGRSFFKAVMIPFVESGALLTGTLLAWTVAVVDFNVSTCCSAHGLTASGPRHC